MIGKQAEVRHTQGGGTLFAFIHFLRIPNACTTVCLIQSPPRPCA